MILNSIHAMLLTSQYYAEGEWLKGLLYSNARSGSYRKRVAGREIISAFQIQPTLRNEAIWVFEVLNIVGRGPRLNTDCCLEWNQLDLCI